MDQAKEMVDQGFLEAGYDYIIVDDCWLDHKRDPDTGKLQPDPNRFPSGMKALGDYVRSISIFHAKIIAIYNRIDFLSQFLDIFFVLNADSRTRIEVRYL